MISYLEKPEPGELLYSVIARTTKLLYPGAKSDYILMVVSGGHRLGVVLPVCARAIQANVPKAADLTDAAMLDGSIYHLMTPYLEADQGIRVREALFSGMPAGYRSIAPNRLKGCPACALDAKRDRKPQIWHVLHNHPAVTACDLHKVLLVDAAPAGGDVLRAPDDFDLTGIDPQPAGTAEVKIAEDVRWLYEQRSLYCPGLTRLRRVLDQWLSGQLELTWHSLSLSTMKLIDAARQWLGTAAPRYEEHLIPDKFFSPDPRSTIARLSLLSQLAGHRFSELFPAAARASANAEVVVAERVLNHMKRRLKKAVSDHPALPRTELRKKAPLPMSVVRKCDPEFYEREMPKRLAGLGGNLEALDSTYYSQLNDHRESFDPGACRGRRHILRAAGIPRNTFRKYVNSLPRSAQLLEELYVDLRDRRRGQQFADAIQAFRELHPDATRTEMNKACSNEVQWLRDNGAKRLEELLPPSHRRASPDYWHHREGECLKRIAAVDVPGRKWTSRSQIFKAAKVSTTLPTNPELKIPLVLRKVEEILATSR